jgi:hypothetical protein
VPLAGGAARGALATATSPARAGKLGAALGSATTKLNVLLVCGAAALGTADTAPPPPRALASQTASVAPGAGRGIDVAAPAPPAAPGRSDAPQAAPGRSDAPRAAIRGDGAGAGEARQLQRERPARVPSLRAELELLGQVRAALDRGDGAAALQALDAHQTRDRVLLAERRAARILALCSLGRVDEARRAAVEFEAAHPRSVQRDVIARSCAIP